jgi:hypothetical protein
MRHAIERVTPLPLFLLTVLAFPLTVWVLHHLGRREGIAQLPRRLSTLS